MQEYPWLRQYDRETPPTLAPYPDKTMVQVVDESAAARPYRAIFFYRGAKLLYDDFVRMSNALAAGLVELGVRRGDRVATLLPNCPQMMIGLQGIWRAGGIAVPLDPLSGEFELQHILRETDPTVVIALNPVYPLAKRLQQGTNIRSIVTSSAGEFLPRWSRLMGSEPADRIRLAEGDVPLQRLLKQYRRSGPPNVGAGSSDIAVILYSGGTTGPARGAVGTHGALVATAIQTNAWLYPVMYEWDDRVLLSMPVFHAWGLAAVLGTAMLNHSSCILVPNPLDWGEIMRGVRKWQPAVMMDIPHFYTNLLAHVKLKKGKAVIKGLRICISGVDGLGVEDAERFERASGLRLIDYYSLTEAMEAPVMAPVTAAGKQYSVGLPLPDVAVKLTDVTTGRELGPGETGEVHIKAPNLMLGYWKRPQDTARVLVDGWLKTADIGCLDEDGYLFLKGRRAETAALPGGHPREGLR